MLANLKGFFASRRGTRAATTVVASGLLLSSVAGAIGISLVYPPPPLGLPAGKTYGQLAAGFWQWALTQPADKSPLFDTTGANCAQGQSGSVWYLAGTTDGSAVTRSCTVPFGKTIVFPIVNAAYFAFADDPPEQKTESFLRSQVKFVEGATNLRAEIDGVPVLLPQTYLEKSPLFSVTLPANNIYGLPAGTVLNPSVDEGYYIAVQPILSVLGPHTIHFHAELNGTVVSEVTYKITVR